MATLVLSTVGNALGGPIAGAIGALIGQSIDRQVFGPGPRQGPRLNDLAVQTSSYGTAIPRIYGTMRVAGSVIWATDLQESSTVRSGGKNQPDVETFSYSVSMAVALSSRTAAGVGRIWADGKLLRGAGGDFKVRTGFRFYAGDEDQSVDPLIASVEGIAQTPAYRGLAIAMFQDLDLSEYGNRIPFLTFELIGDADAPAVGAILADASAGIVQHSSPKAVAGYAAHGANRRAAILPLIENLGLELGESGGLIKSVVPTLYRVHADDLGCGSDGRTEYEFEKAIQPERSTPTLVAIDYYDPARDYQVGRMQASAGRQTGIAEAVDLPIVLAVEAARGLAEDNLARRWAQRERLTLRLPPHYLRLRTGDLVELPDSSRRWTVRQIAAEALIAVAELHPAWSAAPVVVGDTGRPVASPDIVRGPTRMALLDLPDLGSGPVLQLQLAAASSTGSWRPVPIEILIGGMVSSGTSASGEAVLGTALTALQHGPTGIFDRLSFVDIELSNEDQWLESRGEAVLLNGDNLAVIGSEVVQFASAVAIGAKRFRLSQLLRGRFGSEWATSGHATGERFVLLDTRRLRPIPVPDALQGSSVEIVAHAIGDGDGTAIASEAGGEALRPPSPVHLRAGLSGGALEVSWLRRSRSGYAWHNEIDAPLGESAERYRVRLDGSAGSIDVELTMPAATFAASQLAAAGSGPATVRVAQVGDRALSRWTSLPINLP